MNGTFDVEKLLSEVKELTNEAIASWHTKPKAKPYVDKLKFLEHRLPNNPGLRSIFTDFVCHVEAASGQNRQGGNKQHWLKFVERDLIIFEWELKRIIDSKDLYFFYFLSFSEFFI